VTCSWRASRGAPRRDTWLSAKLTPGAGRGTPHSRRTGDGSAAGEIGRVPRCARNPGTAQCHQPRRDHAASRLPPRAAPRSAWRAVPGTPARRSRLRREPRGSARSASTRARPAASAPALPASTRPRCRPAAAPRAGRQVRCHDGRPDAMYSNSFSATCRRPTRGPAVRQHQHMPAQQPATPADPPARTRHAPGATRSASARIDRDPARPPAATMSARTPGSRSIAASSTSALPRVQMTSVPTTGPIAPAACSVRRLPRPGCARRPERPPHAPRAERLSSSRASAR